MYPMDYVKNTPDKAVFIVASTREEVSYLKLEQRHKQPGIFSRRDSTVNGVPVLRDGKLQAGVYPGEHITAQENLD